MSLIARHPLEKEAYSLTPERAKEYAIKFLCDTKVKDRFGCRWLSLFRPFGGGGGLTLGNFVFFYSLRPTFETIGHEYVHVLQYRKYGIFGFILRYILGLFLLPWASNVEYK